MQEVGEVPVVALPGSAAGGKHVGDPVSWRGTAARAGRCRCPYIGRCADETRPGRMIRSTWPPQFWQLGWDSGDGTTVPSAT